MRTGSRAAIDETLRKYSRTADGAQVIYRINFRLHAHRPEVVGFEEIVAVKHSRVWYEWTVYDDGSARYERASVERSASFNELPVVAERIN